MPTRGAGKPGAPARRKTAQGAAAGAAECGELLHRIEQQRALLRHVVDAAPVGLAVVEGPEFRYVLANPAAQSIARAREPLVGRTVADVWPPPTAGELLAVLRRVRERGEEAHVSNLQLNLDRGRGVEQYWFDLDGLPLRGDAAREGAILCVTTETTDLMRAQYRISEDEAAIGRLRSGMEQMLTVHVATQTAAAIAHDLNQPLNAVASYTEAAQRMLMAGNPRPDRLRHALESSAAQAQRAGRVVRELLQFLQKAETATEAVDVNGVVAVALAVVESDGYGGFRAEVNLAPDLRPVRINQMQIERVLVNLMRNSVEAMRAAGIESRSISITISTSAEEGMALVTVRDSGPGLDAATARRAFEPFFSTKPDGVGMGLAICRALVEANGGRLWLEPPDGQGATFHFTLPFVEPDPGAAPAGGKQEDDR
ncbi:MAG TPA: ATP-binding protein [Burkholderiaceae bacterium]|nr:ATP-binding protein [Burkholderiaceae bacterium]